MAQEDPGYLDWIRFRPCSVQNCVTTPCDPDHCGPRGAGQRTHDYLALPLCRIHHIERTSVTGFFKGWTRGQMRIWCLRKISLLLERRAHALETGEVYAHEAEEVT